MLGGRFLALSERHLLVVCILMANGAIAFSPFIPLRTASKSASHGPCYLNNSRRECFDVRTSGSGFTVLMAESQDKGFGRNFAKNFADSSQYAS